MFQKFEIQGVHTTVDDELRSHVTKKIGMLDRYLSRHNRVSAHAEVYLKESKAKNNDHCTCEVTLYLPHQTIFAKESASSMYAAVDVVEVKLKEQLRDYKDQHGGKIRRHIIGRFQRSSK